MDDYPPARPMPADVEARRGAWRLAAPPFAFLAQFGSVYGWTGLACSFGWTQAVWGGLGLIQLVALLITAAFIAVLWRIRPAAEPEPADDIEDPYDPSARRHFIAATVRVTTWLATAGMTAVALSSLFARTCAGGL